MLRNYLKIAWRNLVKQKALAFINIAGLAVGLACFSLFLLYAVNEFSFDRFHANASSLYRVYLNVEAMNGEEKFAASYLPIPLGPALKTDIQGVKDFVRIKESGTENFVRADNGISRVKITFADPQFFSVFTFKMLRGNAPGALNSPANIVLTKEKALQLFGTIDAVGRTVEIKVDEAFEPFIVTAVSENIPPNSTIGFDILASFDYFLSTPYGKKSAGNWHRSGYQTYVLLAPGANIPNMLTSLSRIRSKYYPEEEAELKKKGAWTKAGSPVSYRLQNIRDMHTNTDINGGVVDPVSPKNIWILLALAGSVLLIACINFTTLAMGRSAGRAKEVGIRKVIGGEEKQLVFQFLSEALLLSIFSAALGFILVKWLLPYFNNLSGRELSFSFSQYPEMIWLLAGLIIVAGLLAGSYPALVLSRFNPIDVLKRKIRLGGSNFFTKTLVTTQFILSIGLIISTVVILRQLHFMQGKNPGFSKENVVMVDAEGTDTKKIYPLFKQALAAQPQIAAVAGSELGLGEGTGWSRSGFEYNGKHKDVFEYFVDAGYIPLMKMKLVAGRNFDPSISDDTLTSVIINETMMRDFGWTKANAVGQPLKGYMETLTPVVIGVVEDFHFRPFSEAVEPQMFQQFHDYAPFKYFVRIKAGDPAAALASIQKAWSAVTVLPLKYDFLDDSLDRFYKSEKRWRNIVAWAGGVSIFLACLGLFGLASLAAVNRTKEIGIRKILGAPVASIIGLLSKDFLKLVVIAFVIATPVAWWFMHKWLQDFAYRINIGWWVFAATGLIAMFIALSTVSFQAIRAAIANPIKSLRTE
jgi:putative ABC transport system permease protein